MNMFKKINVLVLFLCFTTAANAQDLREALLACHDIANSSERFECYESIDPDDHALVAEKLEAAQAQKKVEKKRRHTYLERKWHLKQGTDNSFLDFETHKENYIVTSISSDFNNYPVSPTQQTIPLDRNLENQDWRFQLSLKNQIVNDLSFIRKNVSWIDNARLWAAYTQKSFWQIYNGDESRKFRETNYAPELILSLGLDETVNQYMPNMLNLGFIHESNGRDNPESRSWNRLYLQSAWDVGENFTILAKAWWRVPEKNEDDDNPDINKFMGPGELTLRWDDPYKRKSASLLLRNNLRGNNKGYAKLNLSYAPSDFHSFRLFLMLSSGYGESLLDYNFKQTVLGLGVAIGE